MTCGFSLAVFNTLSLLCVLRVLTILCHGQFLFWCYLFGALGTSCTCLGLLFLSLEKNFFYDSVKDMVYAVDLCC